MPIHDWTKVKSGTFHNFHLQWIGAITVRLNAGHLPEGYFAMVEQVVGGPSPDVVTLHGDDTDRPQSGGGIAVGAAPPKTRIVERLETVRYAKKANRIAIHHGLGNVVAVIEIVSPGNKDSRRALRAIVKKAAKLIRLGVNLMVVDLFPPTKRDPQGMHKAIWDEFTESQFQLPPDKPLTLASYDANETKTAYVEPVAVGDVLPDMPLFLASEWYVPVPLEETYQTTWNLLPQQLKRLFD